MTASPALNTPMLRQFAEIKSGYQDAILFFRLGDFYEMFLDDAIIASRELELTLTGRGKDENRVPMCGVPYHAADQYISKLVKNGYKVAICEQIEDAAEAQGITKRDVVKVVTPGTIQDTAALDATENNYILAIDAATKGQLAISFMDISTGEFQCYTLQNDQDLSPLLARFSPKEILINEDHTLTLPESIILNTVSFLPIQRANERLCAHFKLKHLASFGVPDTHPALPAAWALLDYVQLTQKNALSQITRLTPFNEENLLQYDAVSIANLELLNCYKSDTKKGSLFWVLNHTQTAMGARYLSYLIKHPSCDITLLNHRLDAVSSLVNDLLSREEIREILKQVYDIERLIARIVSHSQNPRDMIALKKSLLALKDLGGIVDQLDGHLFQHWSGFFASFQDPNSAFSQCITLLEEAIIDDPPATIREGHMIKEGYHPPLDELQQSFKDIRHWIANLEEKEREDTGIKTLKVGFNKVFGYYFQVSNGQKEAVPAHYIRKQTLTSAERYITPELKEKETILLHGEEKQIAMESALYQDIISQLIQHVPQLQLLARELAKLDCIQSFATISQKQNYTRPQFVEAEQRVLSFVDSKHPVLEKMDPHAVISNSIALSQEDALFFLITGPNMAGKSTLMRQVALLVIMAQIGCFVPAKQATLSPVDRLFTRIGALDNLYAGQSTFMVEMVETASILHTATANSLILLDEIGRGTSTYDGLSIAGAVSEHLLTQIGARTLFATHYHELTSLEKNYGHLKNMNMAIEEHNNQLVFTYTLTPGPADKSYGVHVAEMAGLPDSVIARASQLLSDYEQKLPHPHQLALF